MINKNFTLNVLNFWSLVDRTYSSPPFLIIPLIIALYFSYTIPLPYFPPYT